MRCDGCDTPHPGKIEGENFSGWWHFQGYTGPSNHGCTKGVFHNGKMLTLTGSYCPKCSSAIYDSKAGYETAVLTALMTKEITA